MELAYGYDKMFYRNGCGELASLPIPRLRMAHNNKKQGINMIDQSPGLSGTADEYFVCAALSMLGRRPNIFQIQRQEVSLLSDIPHA